jgi:hypothetical protein
MSDPIHNRKNDRFLVQSSLMLGGREFLIDVDHNGFSYWFDQFAKDQALEKDPNLIAMAMLGDDDSRKFLDQIKTGFTIKAAVPDSDFFVIKSLLSPRYWSPSGFSKEDSQRLDSILEPIFWRDVHPHLTVPVEYPPL